MARPEPELTPECIKCSEVRHDTAVFLQMFQ
jgi:hypothetical protein